MMKKGKYILIMLSLFICAYLFSNRMTPRIENIASKEINHRFPWNPTGFRLYLK